MHREAIIATAANRNHYRGTRRRPAHRRPSSHTSDVIFAGSASAVRLPGAPGALEQHRYADHDQDQRPPRAQQPAEIRYPPEIRKQEYEPDADQNDRTYD